MKNPWLSAWLSASNGAFGAARGHATAAAKRSIANAQREATKQLIELWLGPPPKKRKKRKAR